jgi:glycosyltransferase involved in cell wall biosynthesis
MGWAVPESSVLVGFPSSPSRPGKDYELFRAVVHETERRGVNVVAVVFEGISPAHMPNALRALDVLLMTSKHEGSPVITREALCCGVRVVSVDVGDVRSQLVGFSGCEVVMDRDPITIAEAVLRQANCSPPDAERARLAFDLAHEASQVLSAYKDAVLEAS